MNCPHCDATIPKSILLGSDQKNFRCQACNIVLEVEDTWASRVITVLVGLPTLFAGALKSSGTSWSVAVALWVGLSVLGLWVAYRHGRVRVLRVPANLRTPSA